jgi:hypothetical protein
MKKLCYSFILLSCFALFSCFIAQGRQYRQETRKKEQGVYITEKNTLDNQPVISKLRKIKDGRSELDIHQQKQYLLKVIKAIDREYDIQTKAIEYRLSRTNDQKVLQAVANRALLAIRILEKKGKAERRETFRIAQPVGEPFVSVAKERFLGKFWLPSGIDGLVVESKYAYATGRRAGFFILDISNPKRITKVSHLPLGFINDVAVKGEYAYLAGGRRRFSNGDFSVIDISRKEKPQLVERIDLPRGANRIFVSRSLAFVSAHGAGLFIYDCSAPRRPKYLSKFSMPYNPGEYPRAAQKTLLENHTWGVKTRGNFAYVCDDVAGVRVVDITDIRHPKQISRFMHGKGLEGFCNDVVIDGNYMYLAYDFGYLVIVDISDKKHPKEVGYFNPNGNKTWRQSRRISIRLVKVKDLVYAAQSRDGGVAVINVKDPANPREIFFYEANGSVWGIALANGKLYTGELAIEGNTWGGLEIFSAL